MYRTAFEGNKEGGRMSSGYLISYLFNTFAVLTYICMGFTLEGAIISILICLIGAMISIIYIIMKDKRMERDER